jgi:probable F420-dependent oxidoreductase
MKRPFRFGVQWRAFDDRLSLIDLARQAEQLGYREFFSSDHVGAVDPFVPLMSVAGVTDRMAIGPLVLNNELHHPVLLARTAATIDRLTGGRLVLGIGTGYARAEHESIGSPISPRGARVGRLSETITVLRALLDTGSVTFDGAHHHVAVPSLGVRPVQARVPILVGGHGRRVIELGGRQADIVQFTGLTHDGSGDLSAGGFRRADIDQRSRWLTDAAGDRADQVERSILVQVTDLDAGHESRMAELATQLGLTDEELAETPFVLAGSVERVVDKLERLRECMGISHVVVRNALGCAPIVQALAGH